MKILFIPWMNILKFSKVKFLQMIWVDIWKFWHSMFHFPIYQFVSEICVYVQIVEDSIIICKTLKYLPSQDKVLSGAETCAKRKSTSPCLLAIPAFDRIAGLYDRHLNNNKGICLR